MYAAPRVKETCEDSLRTRNPRISGCFRSKVTQRTLTRKSQECRSKYLATYMRLWHHVSTVPQPPFLGSDPRAYDSCIYHCGIIN